MGKKSVFEKTLSYGLKKLALLSGSFGIKLIAALSFENSVSQTLQVKRTKTRSDFFSSALARETEEFGSKIARIASEGQEK